MRERFGARGGRRLGLGESKVEDPPKASSKVGWDGIRIKEPRTQ
jgi:hypothetical protein